jgi:microcystin-dependent protein
MTETHTSVATDPFGVFGVLVGSISTAQFKNINFGAANYFLKVETKPSASGAYAIISNGELQSSVYAKYANNGNPVGTVISFAGSGATVPAGYLICDGTEVLKTSYPALYAAIGGIWGENGANFNLPDMRGMFLRGFANVSDEDPDKGTRIARNPGGASGNKVGSFQDNQNQTHQHTGTTAGEGNHAHTYQDVFHSETAGTLPAGATSESNPGNLGANGSDADNVGFQKGRVTSGSGAHSHTITTNSSGGTESRPKNVYVLYLIKY